MTTGRDIVYDALRRSGITGRGITPSATDTQDALVDLNDMLAQWRTKSLMVWDKLSTGFVGDGRITPYTVGPGGDYNMTPRPNRIYSAFLRQLQSAGAGFVDTPLKVIDAREEYDRVSLKQLRSFPIAVFLDTALPLGQLYVYPWPSPAGQYAVYITTKGTMPVVTLALDMAGFPEAYIPAMKFNLARRLRQSYGRGMKTDPELIAMANDALSTIEQMNIQLPEMTMPAGLLSSGGGYNIFSDQYGS